jgi:hypothetical protein
LVVVAISKFRRIEAAIVYPSSVILSEVAIREAKGNEVERSFASQSHHKHIREFSLRPEALLERP